MLRTGALRLLLKASKDHLGARDELLGVDEVPVPLISNQRKEEKKGKGRDDILVEGLLVPDNALVDVGLGVRVASGLAGLAAKEAVQVGAGLVRTALPTTQNF